MRLPHLEWQFKSVITQISSKVCNKADDDLWPYDTRNGHLSHKNAQRIAKFLDLLVRFFVDRFRCRINQSYKMFAVNAFTNQTAQITGLYFY